MNAKIVSASRDRVASTDKRVEIPTSRPVSRMAQLCVHLAVMLGPSSAAAPIPR